MKVSVICPFFNEEAIIEKSIKDMATSLETLSHDWELILVNDGSLDNSFNLAMDAASKHPRIKAVGYDLNRGRGYALRYGITMAKGDIVVTTEIDLSWGDDIVHRLVAAFKSHPDADIIIASPNLPGGGYRNVPYHRVFLSRLGNSIIRAGQSRSLTMYTGMTRAYRRDSFLPLPIESDGKEFHLEVAQKAQAYGFKIYEVPCILEWQDHRLSKIDALKRKSSSKIPKLVHTHMAFAAVAAPFRYILPISGLITIVSFVFMAMAMINLFNETPSAFLAIVGLTTFVIALIFLAIGILSYQNNLVQKDIWCIRRDMRSISTAWDKSDFSSQQASKILANSREENCK
jgi:dolichol-phosphate mannosyltransferase